MGEAYLDSSYASLDLIGSTLKTESFEDLLLSLNISQERLLALRTGVSVPLSRIKANHEKDEVVIASAASASGEEEDVSIIESSVSTSVGGFIGGPSDLQVSSVDK